MTILGPGVRDDALTVSTEANLTPTREKNHD
jgi:hypothetical protein